MDYRQIDRRVEAVAQAVEEWLKPGQPELEKAVRQTVDEGLFSLQDIRHRLKILRKSVHAPALQLWVDRSGIRSGIGTRTESGDICPEEFQTLCLHAGNLPLVGFQDLLVCLLLGVSYVGKISRKDPWLLPSFLSVAEKFLPDENRNWSTQLDNLKGSEADFVLFSGSSRSVPGVKQRLKELHLVKEETSYLIRTAHFSIAYIERPDPGTMYNLTEAVFRYGGAGCRSVAVVVSPFSFLSDSCTYTDYIESFWIKNPQHKKPNLSLWQRFAYNKAVDHPQVWLEDFLIEETDREPDQEFVLHWIQGDPEKVRELVRRFGPELQSVYLSGPDVTLNEIETEALEKAQSPPIDWKPDGTDPLEWLHGKMCEAGQKRKSSERG